MNIHPNKSGYGFEELEGLSLEADIYVNEPPRLKHKMRRVKEVIPMLDEVAKGLYVDEKVRIFGIHARSTFDREHGVVKHRMSTGQVKGTSEGFTQIDYPEWYTHFSKGGGDERQLRLIRELRERSIGDIGIAHLIRRNVATANRKDYLTSIHFINRAVAPVASTKLYKEVDEFDVDDMERLQELIRLLTVSKPKAADVFNKIQDNLESFDDPWLALTECAPEFNKLCEGKDENIIAAAHDYMRLVAGPSLFGQVYSFETQVPSGIIQHDKGLNIIDFPAGHYPQFLVMNLAIGNQIEKKNGVSHTSEKQELYAVTHLMADGVVDSSVIFIPIDKLRGVAFSKPFEEHNNTSIESV